MNKKHILIMVVPLIIISFFLLKKRYEDNNIKNLKRTMVADAKRIDFLLKNHNCQASLLDQLRVELTHFQVRTSKMQKMTATNQNFIDVDGTIAEIKKECEL